MDTHVAREALGEGGIAGVALALLGVLVVGRENRRAAVGALAIVAGVALVARGLVDSFLESMGMGFDDLY